MIVGPVGTDHRSNPSTRCLAETKNGGDPQLADHSRVYRPTLLEQLSFAVELAFIVGAHEHNVARRHVRYIQTEAVE